MEGITLKKIKIQSKKIISLILATLILLTYTPLYAIAEELDQNNSIQENNISETNNNITEENKLNNKTETEISANESENGDSTNGDSTNGDSTNDDIFNEENTNINLTQNINSPLSTSENKSKSSGFKLAMRWGGTTSKDYNWDATKSEKRVIKLTVYYQNEVCEKAYNTNDIKITLPGIGKANRASTVKATDIAADEYNTQNKRRDWSYKYDITTDTYTFYNNKEIEQGATFNGSFELLWQLDSRSCVNGYAQEIKATLIDEEETVESEKLTYNYTSQKDTYYINKTAKAITSADGLNAYVAEGKSVQDYAWVQYTFRYNTKELNARGLKSRYIIDTLPQGAVIAKKDNIIQNEDGTISYKLEETNVPENSLVERSIIVGYPGEEYAEKTITNTVYLKGIYKDETEETELAKSDIEVTLKRIQNQTVGIVPGKYVSPDYVYKDTIENDINFTATLYATTTTNAEDAGYQISITDDLLEIYSDTYHTLSDNEYKFTTIQVPGYTSFTNANGYTLEDGEYTLKLYALYKKDVNTRALTEYTKIYEGKWGKETTNQTIPEEAVAIRAEVTGLNESIKSFYIKTTGVINIAENIKNKTYENPTYIINYDFTELNDKNGQTIIPQIKQENYSQTRLYERDNNIYGKGVLRSQDTIRIIERPQTPGYYYAYAHMQQFTVDKNVEYFETNLSHTTTIDNKYENEINSIQLYGITDQEELETLIETINITQKDIKFKNELSQDVNITEYLKERATIQKEGKEISISFDFSDNPIIAKNFSIGYTVDARLNYEKYYNSTNPTYSITTYAYTDAKDMSPQSTGSHNNKTMATARASQNILLALASHQELIKMVKTQYTTDYVQENAVAPMNTEYTYKLKLRNGYNTLVNTEFIDILEHAELTTVDGTNPYNQSEWYGTFKSVDTTYLQTKGLTPKVYYANTTTPDETSWTLMETNENGIWTTTNEVKAVKIKIEGEIEENSIIYININMTSPNDKTLIDKKTYNTYTINSDAIDLYTGVQSTYMKDMPSNATDVRLIEKEYDIEITKTDAKNGMKISGVQFGLYDTEGNKLRSYTTNILGKTIIANIKEGTYILKEEQAPYGYEKCADHIILIKDGNYTVTRQGEVIAQGEEIIKNGIPTINFNIENERAKGSITINKIDEYVNSSKQKIPLQGATFDIMDTDQNVLATKTTDINGALVASELEWGKLYTIKETKAPSGYEPTTQTTYLSKNGKDKVIEIQNKRKTGTVTLTKQDEKDGTKLQGATYGLYAKNSIYDKEGNEQYAPDTKIAEATTDENGKVTFEKLQWGDYYIKEISSVYGYELSNEKHEFTINEQTVENILEKTEKETRKKAHLQILKLDEKGNFLQGVQFALYKENGVQVIKTDENGDEIKYITNEAGQLNINDIEWGNYYIEEINVPEGYERLNTKFTFSVTRQTFENDNTAITSVTNSETNEQVSVIKNNRLSGKVKLTKYACDASGNETETILPQAIYELYKSNGQLLGEYTTDENGQISVQDLEWDSYYFIEKQAPQGYSISDKKIAFVVNSKNAGFEQPLSAYDKQETGEIKINKIIPSQTIYAGHGNSTFLFKIIGKDENGEQKVTLYKALTFTQEDQKNVDENGNITKSIIITNIEPYKYEITEEQNYRYKLSTITLITNAQVENKTGIINLIGSESKGEITFKNEKTSNSLLTDTALLTNTTQAEYYIVGIKVEPKQQTYEIGKDATPSDFTYKLLYSGGQEQSAELTEGITINGLTTYQETLPGSHIAKVQYTINNKTFETEVITKWVIPSDYFTYGVLDKDANTIYITGVNTKYISPEVLYIPSEYNGYKVKQVARGGALPSYKLQNISNVKVVKIENGITKIESYAFFGCSSLTSISIPESVTSIGSNAFYGCSRLTSIEIPEGVMSIGNSAFYNCSSLTSIKIPEGLTSIGNSAFYNCSSLTNIEIPKGVTSIETSVFENCGKLTSIRIPEGVTSIGVNAFANCNSLTGIDMPESVTSIKGAAFYNCSSLISIEIPEEVTSIEGRTFFGCRRLISVNIPKGVTSIGNYAFGGCSGLTKIDIPESVISIGNGAFSGCSGLTKIDIPESVINIGNYAFYNCWRLTSIEIPEKVTSIGNYTFYECSGLTSVKIPEGVTNIGDSAFYKCNHLTSIEIPEGVTSIGNSAFYGCSNLISIEIPKGVTKIGNSIFADCYSLTSIEIPEGVTSIGDSAFYRCQRLTSIGMPEGVTSIGNSAFSRCGGLTRIDIPGSVISIGNYAFSSCWGLTSIKIPESVASIGNDVFSMCNKLAEIDVSESNKNYCSINGVVYNKSVTMLIVYPAGKSDTEYLVQRTVTSIGISAFSDCSHLTSIEIPEGVTSICDKAFSGCSSLTSIEIPKGVTSIGSLAFFRCGKLKKIEIPEEVTSIESSAFRECGLTSIIIPKNVTSIKYGTFDSCSGLKSIEIPEKITSIEGHAFSGCRGLESIIYNGTEEQFKLIEVRPGNDYFTKAQVTYKK